MMDERRHKKSEVRSQKSEQQKLDFGFRTSVLILLFILSFVCSVAFADAIYLKNGTVMTGRIVEKNDKFLILKSGEGEASVRTTIFLEDVNRIESEKSYYQTLAQQDASRDIRRLLEENREFQIAQGTNVKKSFKTGWVREDTEASDKEQDLLEEDTNKKETKAESKLLQPLQTGEGSISGTINLADSWQENRGDLYVYLLNEAGVGKFESGPTMRYEHIAAEDITSQQVEYSITGLPLGNYKVFCHWDISAPYITQKNVKEKNLFAFISGSTGDYTGASKDTIVLTKTNIKVNVIFDCKTPIKASEAKISGDLNRAADLKADFTVKDILYRRLGSGEPEFTLIIKNNAERTIDKLTFDIFINDEKVVPEVLDFEKIESGQEKEFNITFLHKAYKKKVLDRQGAEGLFKVMKFKVVLFPTGEIELEKTIFII